MSPDDSPEEDPREAGRKRDRDNVAEDPSFPDGSGAGGTPADTQGLAQQKKPRLTFGGGLRAISASQALEKKKLDPNSPADINPAASPHPAEAAGPVAKPGEVVFPSPLGGTATEVDQRPEFSLGEAAMDGEKKPERPRLVFPAAANASPTLGADDRPKPRLTFGGGLATTGTSNPAANTPAVSSNLSLSPDATESAAKPRLVFGSGLAGGCAPSSGGLRWPAVSSRSSVTSSPGVTSAIPQQPASSPVQQQQYQQVPTAGFHGSGAMPHSQAQWDEGMMGSQRVLSSMSSARSPRDSMASPRTMHGVITRGGASSSGAAHLEALSDSDGEGDGRTGESPRGLSGVSHTAAIAPDSISKGQQRRGETTVNPLSSGELSSAASSLAADAAQKSPRGTAGATGGQGKVEGDGGAGEAKEEESQHERLLSSGEILKKIEVLDEAIASTDSEIAGLQADALHGEGVIFGMQATKQPVKGPRLDAEGLRILESNKKFAARRRQAMSLQTMLPEESFFESTPLYTCAEESPYFVLNLERHEVIKHHVESQVRRCERERRRAELVHAVEYRQKMQAWIKANNLPPMRQRKQPAIPELLADGGQPRRRTRSADNNNKDADGADDDDDDDCSASLAVVPSMLSSLQGSLTRASFRSHNALVLDPVDEEIRRHFLNVWSEEEKQVFVEKLVDFSLLPESKGMKKNFHRISQHLPNKTTRDCVQFYYLNKKTKFFKVLYKKFEQKNRKSYSLKNKYRGRDDSKDRTTFADMYAIEECPTTTFSCIDPSILLNRPDDNDDDQPEMSYQRRKNYVYGYGR